MQKVDLLEGSIVRSLTSLALPIMATSLIQMAYNMTDMIWIGRVSANAVAAVGAAGMYLWLANGLAMIPRLGGQVKVAHELGAQNIERAASYGQAAFHLGALLVVLFTTLCITLNGPLIAFFRLNTPSVIADARTYLVIVAAGFFFSFFNQIFTGMFTAMGGKRGGSALHGHRAGGEHHSGPAYDLWDRPIPADGRGRSRHSHRSGPGHRNSHVPSGSPPRDDRFSANPYIPGQSVEGLGGDFENRFACLHPEHVFLRPLHDPRQARRGLGGRRYRGSEGRFADRVHLLDHGGGICHVGQRIYRTKLRRGPDGAHP